MGFLEEIFKEKKRERGEKKRLVEIAKESRKIREREDWKRKKRKEKAFSDATSDF
jgi:hypothetical protein